ncbi:hypothetical protein OHA98_02095 [Streptomyces sp. NBC_00654]|uniref:hypothetical protein n=1 Tax=Streptomyces sp. NBC_00654 TaxID=2975799 RepID=UPI00224F092B|nr:hypothetical protein [Streptomyces sp. NBC_00654]MCX4963625.1 hypothetical protein [Streptomyces sp. NBC_00654]
MTSYGYRLFTLSVFRGSKRTPINFKDCEGEHYKETVARLLKSLEVPVVGDPPSSLEEAAASAPDDFRGKPALRIEGVELVDNTVRATVWVGKIGSHAKAMSRDVSVADFDISDKAAINGFRVVFAFPEDGTKGILAVESISRSCPVAPLVKWLRYRSLEEDHKKNQGAGVVALGWRSKVEGLTDEARLSEMIEAGLAQGLVLVKQSITPGRTRAEKEFEIRAPLVNDGKVKQVAALVRGWAAQAKDGDGSHAATTNAQAARQLAAIVSSEIKDLDLNDGWVELADPDDQVRRINPSTMTDVFTYKLSEDQPVDTPKFYAEVRGTAVGLQAAAKIAIEWPLQ